MPVEYHPVFQAPDNPDIKIWRYMDFAKYVSFLDTNALFFPRSDRLDDPYEGTWSDATWGMMRDSLEQIWTENDIDPAQHDVADIVRQFREGTATFREWVYVNSWHMNEVESAAMWGLYAQRDQGIAVQSTYAKLAECLPAQTPSRVFESPRFPGKRIIVKAASIHLGTVVYVEDYKTNSMSTNNILYPFIHKRRSFAHERELRAVILESAQVEDPTTGELSPIHAGSTNPAMGLRVDVSIDDLVEKVLVAPTAPSWFGELVENISAKYNLDSRRIDKSRLYERRMI